VSRYDWADMVASATALVGAGGFMCIAFDVAFLRGVFGCVGIYMLARVIGIGRAT